METWQVHRWNGRSEFYPTCLEKPQNVTHSVGIKLTICLWCHEALGRACENPSQMCPGQPLASLSLLYASVLMRRPTLSGETVLTVHFNSCYEAKLWNSKVLKLYKPADSKEVSVLSEPSLVDRKEIESSFSISLSSPSCSFEIYGHPLSVCFST